MSRIVLSSLYYVLLPNLLLAGDGNIGNGELNVENNRNNFNLSNHTTTREDLNQGKSRKTSEKRYAMVSNDKEEKNYILGVTYLKLEKYDEALAYLEKAAENADPGYENHNAEYAIGRIYEFAKSHTDYNRAEHWYILAARHGSTEAIEAIERVNTKKNNSISNYLISFFY